MYRQKTLVNFIGEKKQMKLYYTTLSTKITRIHEKKLKITRSTITTVCTQCKSNLFLRSQKIKLVFAIAGYFLERTEKNKYLIKFVLPSYVIPMF